MIGSENSSVCDIKQTDKLKIVIIKKFHTSIIQKAGLLSIMNHLNLGIEFRIFSDILTLGSITCSRYIIVLIKCQPRTLQKIKFIHKLN